MTDLPKNWHMVHVLLECGHGLGTSATEYEIHKVVYGDDWSCNECDNDSPEIDCHPFTLNYDGTVEDGWK